MMMPIDLNAASSAVTISNHDHCQEAASASFSEDGKSGGSANATHYCCAVAAILVATPVFLASKQVDDYLQSNLSKPDSHVVESIYKPPKNYL